ncbi:hypothetical protein PR003_g13958 [Phytophthora rubi]|uniref:Uncharacterized protein n=2 Tax=Phytophthora TaxID=4783 RepID=A0A6A3LQK1_9STRA|nr:hypothetical protein PR002_g13501 [Phytophthora rubi]KAE9021509.1 hypothetical protein PR001_g13354 [Phytophthora rubi]KAE9333568.1 hypothetical protein PR003_g13958 [Phytophthora rubi]KAE9334199.1 hypothetical protein PF008_g14083 [Phytophthora fragariae]
MDNLHAHDARPCMNFMMKILFAIFCIQIGCCNVARCRQFVYPSLTKPHTVCMYCTVIC